MERHGKQIRHSSLNLLQDILSFLVIFFLSFPNLVKEISHGLVHSKQGHGLTHVHPSLRTKDIPSSCTYDFYQDPSVKPHKNNDHPYKTHGATVDSASFFESLGRDLQHFSDQEYSLFPSELASLCPTSIDHPVALSLSPTALELK